MEQYSVYHQNEHQPKIIGLTALCGTKLKNKLEFLLACIGSRSVSVIPVSTNERKLVEEKQKVEKTKNFTNIILINYMITFVKRFNDIIKKLDSFYK
jgi:predicted RNA-binding protein with PUA-like domain